MASKKISKDKFFDQEVMKNARAGAEYWYEEIWQNVGKCVFCDLKEKYIIHEKDGIVLTTNLFPYIDGQLMVMPRRHVNSLKELTMNEWEIMRTYGYLAKKLFRKVHKLKDMWFLLREGGPTAQKTVTDHLHVQLVPFDKPDLAKWNYRKLKFTPLENAKNYQDLSNYIEEKLEKFTKKYSAKTTAPVIVVDAFIQNKDGEILIAKKRKGFEKDKDVWVLPGGRVNPEEELIKSLLREIKEETSIRIDEKNEGRGVALLSSMLADSSYKKPGRIHTERMMINTYLIKLDTNPKVKAGDDLGELKWATKSEISKLECVFDKKLLKNI